MRRALASMVVLGLAIQLAGCGDSSGGDRAGDPGGSVKPSDIELTPVALVDDGAPKEATAAIPPTDAALPPGTEDYLAGLDELTRAEWAEARAAFEKALQANEESPDFLLARGVSLLFAEKLQEAEADFKRAGMLGGDRDTSRLWQATAVAMQGDFMRDSTIYPAATEDLFEYNLREMSRQYGQKSLQDGRQSAEDKEETRRKQRERDEFEEAIKNLPPEARKQMEAMRDGDEKAQADERAGWGAEAATKRQAAVAQFPTLARQFVARTQSRNPGLTEALLRRAEKRVAAGDHAGALADLYHVTLNRPTDTKALYLQSIALLNTGAPEGARRLLTRLLTQNPDEPAFYQARALAEVRLGNTRQANEDLAVLKKMDKPAGAAKDELAGASQATPRDALAERVSDLQRAAKSGARPDDLVKRAEAIVKAANAHRLRSDERYQSRLRELQEQVRAKPRDADAWTELGRFRYEEAANIFGEAVEPRAAFKPFRPEDDETRVDEVARAERCCDKALELNPNHVRALAFKAACRIYNRQWGDAETLLRKAIELDPSDAVVLDLFAQVLNHAASVKTANAANLRATESWEDTSYIYFRYPSQADLAAADALDAQAQRLWEMSRKAVDAAIAANKGEFEGYYMEGVKARREGNPAAAAAAFAQAVKLQPDNVKAREMLAASLGAAGKIEESLLEQATAMNLTHTTAAPHLKLAWLHAQRTAWKSAQRAVDSAIAADPADPRGAAYAGALALHQGKADEALGWFAAAAALDEANARLNGTTLRGREGPPLTPDAAGRVLAEQLTLADLCLKHQRPEQALQAARDAAQLDSRFTEDGLYERPASALLPRPFEVGEVPRADNVVYMLAMAYLREGQALDALGKPDEADAAYGRVIRFETERSPVRDIGAEIHTPVALAKFAKVKRLVAAKRWDEAHRAMMEVGRPWGLPDDVEAEIRAVQEQINDQRQAAQDAEEKQQRQLENDWRERQMEEFNRRREETDRRRQEQREQIQRRRAR